jgi:hypothetical protein
MIDIYGGGGVYRVNDEMHTETHAFLPLGRDQSYKSYIYIVLKQHQHTAGD